MDSLKNSDDIAAKGETAPRVSLQSMKEKIAAESYFTAGEAGDALNIPMHSAARLLTVCILTMKNGFTIIGKSAPASPENFDTEKGRHFAYEDAIKQLWPLEDYALREKLTMIEDLKGAVAATVRPDMDHQPVTFTSRDIPGAVQDPPLDEPMRHWPTKDGYENED